MASTESTAAYQSRIAWFGDARFGMFIHWGPYAAHGRGEQVLIRELLDQRDYENQARQWNPGSYDPKHWAAVARDAGMRYAVLTTRHHDGYCLWDSKLTDYTSAAQAPKRDFVREYVDAFRAAGLRVGLYYSLADFRIPAYFTGPAVDPAGWNAFRDYVHGQVRELLSNYGKIDVIWFDGVWPRPATDWGSLQLIEMIRSLQPQILINNRLDDESLSKQVEQAGASSTLGDFGTPEHHITPDRNRAWESCQVTTSRLWGFTRGERWRTSEQLLDMLTDCASKGGNLLLNVGPDENGKLPEPYIEQMRDIGQWMKLHSECIYGSEGGDVTEFVTRGRQIRKGCKLYLVLRFWDSRPELRMVGLGSKVVGATLLTTGQKLQFTQNGEELILRGLPTEQPCKLFPVIRIECDSIPAPADSLLARQRLWTGDGARYADWAKKRGQSVWINR